MKDILHIPEHRETKSKGIHYVSSWIESQIPQKCSLELAHSFLLAKFPDEQS